MLTVRLTSRASRLPRPSARGLCDLLGAGMLPRTVQLCIHCRQNPAGFWVSRREGQVARRPWCLSCTLELDQDRCVVTRFGS